MDLYEVSIVRTKKKPLRLGTGGTTMTNGEKFRSPEERAREYKKYCASQGGCNKCPLKRFSSLRCLYEWLELEYKEEVKPCPYCGYTEIDVVLSHCHGGYDACCKDCGATVVAQSKTEVINKWNRRV